MSEAQLHPRKATTGETHRAAPGRAAADAQWNAGASDAHVTEYDEVWYRGRPQRP
jgi:hypothetical protein